MEYKNLILEKDEGVGIIKINRPDALNSLNSELLSELSVALDEIESDENILCLIITGEGKAFIAGADISEMKDLTVERARKFAEKGQNLFRKMERMETVIIAAINGFALGGGMELALGCDFRLASEKAKLGQPEVTLGVTPGFGATSRLRRTAGEGNSRMLLFTGDMIKADEAYRMGIVQAVYPPEELVEKTMEKAKMIASRGPSALKLMKKLLSVNAELGIEAASTFESVIFSSCFASGEAKEGMSAFLEKRSPDWKSVG